MYIAGFHIDGFGIFNNTGCANLGPGLTIFYGQNEAGKTTCLDFFRIMLTGYPERQGRNERSYEPLRGGRPGGSLLLHCEHEPFEVRLSRSTSSNGGLRLYTADGAMLAGETLARIMGGISRDVYRRVFGFSLGELEQWDKKSDQGIRNALYGASFGPGLVAPGMAIDKLQKHMGALYKSRSTQQPLSATLLELEKLKNELAAIENECSIYDSLAQEHEQVLAAIAQVRLRKDALETESRESERRLAHWHNWDLWRSLEMSLARLENVPPDFPEEAQMRLAALDSACTSAASSLATAREKLAQIEARAATISINALYLSELPALKRLTERKSSYRQAKSLLPGLETGLQEAREALAGSLTQLGPTWDCDKIRQTDRSLFAREGMERLAAALGSAHVAWDTAKTKMTVANGDIENAQRKINTAESALEQLPEPQAILSGNERDDLRAQMNHLEEIRRNVPARERALEHSENAQKRALEQAQLFGSPSEYENDRIARVLADLLARQEEIQALAAAIQADVDEAGEAAKALAQKEAEAEALKERIGQANTVKRQAGGSTREALDAKTAALRSLRQIGASIENEQERKSELEARLAQEKLQPRMRNWTLIAFAILFFAGAACIFCAYWFFGIQEFVITPDTVLPLNLWGAYAALFCGVILLGSGLSAHGPEYRRRKQEYAQLVSRSEASSMRLAELDEQARELFPAAGVTDIDPIGLDAMEMLIEREKEQLFHEERSRMEVEDLSSQLEAIQAAIAGQLADARQKEAKVQRSRKRWHDLMQSLHIEKVPTPESIATVFARAESARLAQENVTNSRNELDALWEDLHLVEQAITNMPVIQEKLASAPEPLSLEEAVRQTLDNCQDADKIRERRLRLMAEIDAATEELESARKSHDKSADEFAIKSRELDEARHNWTTSLEKLGLSGDMDPETVREAYKYMQECLQTEERVKRLERELQQAQAEIDGLELPLQKQLAKLESEPQQILDSGPDWLATLDALVAEGERNVRQSERLEAINQEIAVRKEDIAALAAAAEMAEANLKAFLDLGHAQTKDEFLRMARVRDERRALRNRQEEAEAMMREAARGTDLESYIASFNGADRATYEKRLREIKEEREALEKQELELAREETRIQIRMEEIANTDEVGAKRQKEAMLEESARRLASEWSRLALAEGLLREARNIFEKERQPEIVRSASEIFATITDGRWAGMSLNLEDSSLLMLPQHGEPAAPAALSRGAQEQAYLALRLAYIKKHAESAEPLPLIMDEVLVNFDPVRAAHTAQAFARLTRDGLQQILYFTCQPHIVELLQKTFGNASLYLVENGTITPSDA